MLSNKLNRISTIILVSLMIILGIIYVYLQVDIRIKMKHNEDINNNVITNTINENIE